MPPWTAEIAVDAPLARALIDAQFPDLAGEALEPFGAGWDNTVFRAGAWVFRFPRRRVAVACLEAELRVLPRIAPALPLPVPVPERLGRPEARYPWPFAGHRLIPGRTADRAGLDDAARAALAAPLGRFLAALHALPPGDAGPDTIGRTDVRTRAARARERLGRVALDPELSRALALIVDETPVDAPRPPPVLVHGDLYARQLLVDDRGALAAVIDWGDVHAGDPAIDLAIAWTLVPPAARATLREAYGEIDDATLALARFRAVYHTLSLVDYAESIGDAVLFAECRAALASAIRSNSS